MKENTHSEILLLLQRKILRLVCYKQTNVCITLTHDAFIILQS